MTLHIFVTFLKETNSDLIFIRPMSDHSQPMSVWLTDSLTDELLEDWMNWPKYADDADYADYADYTDYADYAD